MKESAKDKNKRRKIQLYGTVAGKIVQKYNCITKLSDELDINRKKLSKVIKEGVDVLKARRNQRTIGPENAHLKPDLGVLSHHEMTLTLNTHTPLLTSQVVCICKVSGLRLQ